MAIPNRWICTEDCRALGRNFRKDEIIEYPTNPNSLAFVAYTGDEYQLLDDKFKIDRDETVYLPRLAWDDMTFPSTRVRQGALLKPDFDYTNVGLLFPQNDPADKVYITDQFRHHTYKGDNAVIRPHVHWVQSQADVPVWKLDYRFHDNGSAEAAWETTLVSASEVFTYVSGDLTQISIFPEIPIAGYGTSALFDFILYRDDNVVTGDVLMKSFDFHYQIDCFGSGGEYNK